MPKRTQFLTGGLLVALALILVWAIQVGDPPAESGDPTRRASAPPSTESNLVGDELTAVRSDADAVQTVSPNDAATMDAPVATEAPEPEPLPAGTVEVLVQHDGVPVTSGFLHLKAYDQGDLPEDPWTTQEALVHAEIDPNGVARFINVGEVGHYRVGVEWPRASYYAASRVFSMPTGVGKRITIDLGSGRIVGTVYGAEGKPAPGVTVSSYLRVREYVVEVVTDAQGAYVIEHAAPGFWMMTVEVPESPNGAPALTLHAKPVLEEGATQRVDFGRAGPWPTWRGHVVDGGGLPVPNRGPRQSNRGRIHLYDLEFGTSRSFPYKVDGSFEFQIPAGTYQVKLKGPTELPTAVVHEEFAFPLDGSTQDLVLPGASLRGTIIGSDGGPYTGPHAAGLQVSVLTEERDYLVASVSVGPDGTYVLPGLEPGRYFVNTWRAPPVEDQIVELTGDSTSVTWDITVKEP